LWNLETLDISGARNIDDQCITHMAKNEVIIEDNKHVCPGMQKLTTVKIGHTNLTDFGVVTLCKMAPNIEHLELNRLEALTEYSLKFVFKELHQLKFLDTNGVTAVTYPMLDELKQTKPHLVMRMYRFDKLDKKDNGLRVPRRVVEKKKKKKKKGGKKKK